MLSHNPSQATPRPTNGLASVLPFDLIFFLRSSMVAILCCYFIFSSSVCSSCLLCRRLNEEKSLAQQSSLHFLIPYFLLLRTLFHSVASAFEGPFIALFDFVLVQDFLFHSLRQVLPAKIHLTLVQSSPSFHLFCIFHHLAFLSFLHWTIQSFTLAPCDLRTFTTSSGTFFVLHPTLRSFHSSSFKQVIQMLFIFPLFYHLVAFLLTFFFSSFSICELSHTFVWVFVLCRPW